MLERLWREVRFAARRLSRERFFALTALTTLVVALGANTAGFSILDSILLRPLPYASPDRLVALWKAYPQRGIERFVIAPASFRDYREQSTVFEEAAAFSGTAFDLSGDGQPERIQGLEVTPSIFPLLGVKPERGTVFSGRDALEDGRLAVISHQLWKTRFGGDPDLVGRTIQLDRESYRVSAIMPPDFRFPPPLTLAGRTYSIPAQIWIPLAEESEPSRTRHSLIGVARLKEGVSLEAARAEMDAIAARLAVAYPDHEANSKLALYPLADEAVLHLRRLLYVFLGALGLLLLIACVNLASLVSARAISRTSEVAVRSALGARPLQLARQIVVEGLLLSVVGGALGCLLAVGLARALVAASPEDLSYFSTPTLSPSVLLFSLGLCALATLLFSAWPALRVYRVDLVEHLQSSRNTAGAKGRGLWHSGLVAAEVALAVILVAGTALLVRSLDNLLAVDLGFDPENVLTAQVILTAPEYADPDARTRFCGALTQAARQLPGVVAAGLVDKLPLSGARGRLGVEIQDRPSTSQEPELADFQLVNWSYLPALGFRTLQGTPPASDAETTQVVVNRALAERVWPGEEAVGKRLRWRQSQDWFTVAAVIDDIRAFRVDEEPAPALYAPLAAQPPVAVHLVLRSSAPRSELLTRLRETLSRLNPNLPLAAVQSMDEVIGSSLSLPRFGAAMVSGFSVVALLLAAVGIYGLVAHWVGRRRQEFGIRLALGDNPGGIQRRVVGSGVKLGLIGVAAGLAATVLLSGYASSLLFGVTGNDALTLAGVSLFMLAVTGVACLLPARRASRVDPAEVLRPE